MKYAKREWVNSCTGCKNPFEKMLENQDSKSEIPTMTSTITTKGQTVVPKELRAAKLARFSKSGFAQALRRLGRVPAAPRDNRQVADA